MVNMYRSLNEICAFCFIALFFTRCGFMDLRPVSVSVFPQAGAVLPDLTSPVRAVFDTAMREREVERIFSVEFSGGKIEGDFHWKERELYFYPVAGWTPGVRYTLSLNGSAYSKDGRDADFSVFVPFYAVNAGALPYLKGFYPDDGASTGVLPEDGGKVILFFSEPMNRRSVEDAFSIDGIDRKVFIWNDADTKLEVRPREMLNAWSVYRWSIETKARSAAGAPLAKNCSAQFTANKDTTFPFVKYVSPVLKTEGVDGGYRWIETGGKIENQLGRDQGIALVFSKAMDKNSIVSGIRFEPSISGIVEQYSPETFIFLPLREPEIGTLYRLTVSADTKDAYGLKLTEEYAVNFIVEVPYLEIVSIMQSDLNQLPGDTENRNMITVKVSKATKECKLSFQFSPAVNDLKSRETIARSIRLDAFFPGTISTPVLRAAKWIGTGFDRLELEWIEAEPGDDTEPHYYRLTIPGGLSGISNGAGSFLKDTIIVYLEIIEA
jgi:hypothetical protein